VILLSNSLQSRVFCDGIAEQIFRYTRNQQVRHTVSIITKMVDEVIAAQSILKNRAKMLQNYMNSINVLYYIRTISISETRKM
jgi:hypothetical protein